MRTSYRGGTWPKQGERTKVSAATAARSPQRMIRSGPDVKMVVLDELSCGIRHEVPAWGRCEALRNGGNATCCLARRRAGGARRSAPVAYSTSRWMGARLACGERRVGGAVARSATTPRGDRVGYPDLRPEGTAQQPRERGRPFVRTNPSLVQLQGGILAKAASPIARALAGRSAACGRRHVWRDSNDTIDSPIC
jgi:hypothetical protein